MIRRWAACLAALLLLVVQAPAHSLEISVVNKASGLPSDWVSALASDGGKVWVGTGNRGLALWDPARGTFVDHSGAPGFTSKAITSVAVFRDKVYAGTELEAVVFDGKKWDRLGKADTIVMRNVRFASSPDGRELWAASMALAGGTVRFDGEKWTFMGGQGRGLFSNVTALAFGPKGTWMGTLSGAVYLHKGADVEAVSGGLSGNVSSLARAGDALFAGTSKGLFRLDGSTWKKIAFPAEWGSPVVIAMAARGDVLYAGTTAGMVRVSGTKIDRLTEKDGLPSSRVQAVLVDGETVYGGTLRGLAAIRGW